MQKCPKMHLNGNGSPKYRKQSTRRGCPTATDRPETISGPKMIKNVDSRRSKNSEKTNARRRILHLSGLKNSIKKMLYRLQLKFLFNFIKNIFTFFSKKNTAYTFIKNIRIVSFFGNIFNGLSCFL